MAGKKITELSSSIAPSLTGVTAVAFGGTTYKSTLSTLRQTLVDSGSHVFTGSQIINGNLTISGSVTAQQFILSSSISNIVTETISGSSNFGNSLDDRHVFTGSVQITGSLNVTGSANVNGSTVVSSNTINKIETVTSASYVSITPVSGTMYVIIN